MRSLMRAAVLAAGMLALPAWAADKRNKPPIDLASYADAAALGPQLRGCADLRRGDGGDPGALERSAAALRTQLAPLADLPPMLAERERAVKAMEPQPHELAARRPPPNPFQALQSRNAGQLLGSLAQALGRRNEVPMTPERVRARETIARVDARLATLPPQFDLAAYRTYYDTRQAYLQAAMDRLGTAPATLAGQLELDRILFNIGQCPVAANDRRGDLFQAVERRVPALVPAARTALTAAAGEPDPDRAALVADAWSRSPSASRHPEIEQLIGSVRRHVDERRAVQDRARQVAAAGAATRTLARRQAAGVRGPMVRYPLIVEDADGTDYYLMNLSSCNGRLRRDILQGAPSVSSISDFCDQREIHRRVARGYTPTVPPLFVSAGATRMSDEQYRLALDVDRAANTQAASARRGNGPGVDELRAVVAEAFLRGHPPQAVASGLVSRNGSTVAIRIPGVSPEVYSEDFTIDVDPAGPSCTPAGRALRCTYGVEMKQDVTDVRKTLLGAFVNAMQGGGSPNYYDQSIDRRHDWTRRTDTFVRGPSGWSSPTLAADMKQLAAKIDRLRGGAGASATPAQKTALDQYCNAADWGRAMGGKNLGKPWCP